MKTYWRVTVDSWKEPVLWIQSDYQPTIAFTPSNYHFAKDYDYRKAWLTLLSRIPSQYLGG